MDALSFKQIEKALKNSPALPDIFDARDWKFEDYMAVGDVEIPEEFSLRPKQTGVRNQGSRGTCVGHGGTAETEYFNKAEFNLAELDLSEEMLFRKTKEYDVADYNYTGYGAHIRSVCKALVNYGTCLEKTLPYKPNASEDSWKEVVITDAMLKEAETYKLKSYLSVSVNVEAIQRAILTSNAPVVGGFTLFSSYKKAKTNGGIVPVPTTTDTRVGGHCMLIVGWKKIKGVTYFELKNSWGANWGDKGYIWWPSTNLAAVHSLWSFVDLSTNPNVDEDAVIAKNKALLKRGKEGLVAWTKGLEKGLLNSGSVPTEWLTKEDFVIFLNRLGLLD